MADNEMKAECLEILEAIFNSRKDIDYPTHQSVENIALIASQEGYKVKTVHGVKEYNSIGEVFDALLEVELLHCDDGEQLLSLLQNLRHIHP